MLSLCVKQIKQTLHFSIRHEIFKSMKDLAFVPDFESRFIFDSLYTTAAGTPFFFILTMIFLIVSVFFLLSPTMKLHEEEKLVKEA